MKILQAAQAVILAILLFASYISVSKIFFHSQRTHIEEKAHLLPTDFTVFSTSLSNDEYKKQFVPHNFSIDDTDLMKSMTSLIPAIPSSFGYTEKEANSLFPAYQYPRCEDIYNDTNYKLNFNTIGNSFSLECEEGTYILGPPFYNYFTNPKYSQPYWEIQQYQNFTRPLWNNHEFAMATCKKNSTDFDMFAMKPKLNLAAYIETKQKIDDLQTASGTNKKPILIAMLTLDSFSRRHFFRKLPKTVELLNRYENSKDWKVFDFKFHNIIGARTSDNQANYWGLGKKIKENSSLSRFGKHAIWRKLKELGFMTLFGYEGCPYGLVSSIGSQPDADSVVQPFYCAAHKFTNYSSHKGHKNSQRCIGPHMSHWYLMDYSINFAHIYLRANLWIYNHFTAAHESTGQHASTLDEDLRNYIRNLTEIFSESHEVVILLAGDHGMRYINYKSNTNATQEHRLPAFFFMSSRKYLDSIENSYAILEHNTFRLTTKPDLRSLTIKLAELQYNLESKRSQNYYNLITEEIPNTRTCKDAKISPWYCGSNVMKQLDLAQEIDEGWNKLILRVVTEALDEINLSTYASNSHRKGLLCKKLSLDKLKYVIYSRTLNANLLMKVQFTVIESEGVTFEFWAYISEDDDLSIEEGKGLKTFPVIESGVKKFAKIINIYRADSYEGKCEDTSISMEYNPELCVCDENVIENLA
ncbi:unnamed protein product [Blepharisma stoltei]|uniref:Uncharacterized protein n=1 Tax=Blepharisma stoltei TaxID=1481888 RepID=A0AAU9ILQ6_9CILI|nr:unnamed protein product [Blepharisma stoltei]